MGKRLLFVIISISAIILSSCGGTASSPLSPVTNVTLTTENVTRMLEASTQSPANTPTVALTPTPQPSLASTPLATSVSCNDNNADFVADVTIPDGTVITPGEQFVKTWRIRNSGHCTWKTGYHLAHVDGPNLDAPSSVELAQDVKPGKTIDLSVTFIASREPGIVKSRWQMQDPANSFFGEKVYVKIYAGTSPVDEVVGTWIGTSSGAAEGYNGADPVSAQEEFEIRSVCRNGQPCVRFSTPVGKEEVPFTQEKSEASAYCFSDGANLYCFSLQSDGTLSYQGSGPLWAVTATLHKVAE